MIVLVDRGIGLLGLVFVAATGASVAAWISPTMGPIGPGVLWAGLAVVVTIAGWAILVPQSIVRLLSPARRLHPEWFDEQLLETIECCAGARFRDRRQGLIGGRLLPARSVSRHSW